MSPKLGSEASWVRMAADAKNATMPNKAMILVINEPLKAPEAYLTEVYVPGNVRTALLQGRWS
jgi:hypothetical protein